MDTLSQNPALEQTAETPETSRVIIGLAQINNSFSNQNYLPYSVACLEGYVKKFAETPERFDFLRPVYKRQPIHAIVDHLIEADIVGFSTYVWNAEISLEIARRLKAAKPEIIIVFGGPQFPDDAEAFLRENPFIDLGFHNEGERSFTQFVNQWPSRDYTSIPGTSFIDSSGCFNKQKNGHRIRDLEEVPSPFLNGLFDALIDENPEESWIGLWETNRGCPFACTFCDWGSATASKVNRFGLERLDREIRWFAKNRIEYIFCCDANFGILARDVDIARSVARIKADTGYPVALSVQNTKNATERAYETQKILADAGLNKGVALSMQSVDDETLTAIRRDNIGLNTYWELQRRFSQDRIETYSDLILGLPGETYDSFADGVDLLIRNGQHNRIQFNNCSILPNSEMAAPDYRRRYEIETVTSEIINIHGTRDDTEDDVKEWQQLIVSTNTMTAHDWRRVRAFSWMVAFLHFDKIFQYPMILACEHYGLRYRDIVEAFLDIAIERPGEFPVLSDIADFFVSEAQRIQQGGVEYVYSKDWLGIYWPADEFMYIKLSKQDLLDDFYSQAATLLSEMVGRQAGSGNIAPLIESVAANRALLCQPGLMDDTKIDLTFNVIEYCDAIKAGESVPLVHGLHSVAIRRTLRQYTDFNEWCREVVWWGNKKGAYLYSSQHVEKQLAGHY